MTVVFREFPSTGVVALFTETAGGGNEFSPSADRNEPAADPDAHLDKIKLHTALDNLEIVVETSVEIEHDAVSGSSAAPLGVGANDVTAFGEGVEDHLLVTHSLGYVPDFAVSTSGIAVAAYPVQISGSRARYATAYATTTEIRLHCASSVGASGLGAVDITYDVLVFREPRDASGDKLFDFNPTTGVTKLGFNRFSSDRKYLQALPEGVGSPISLPYGKTIDASNGAARFASSDSTFEPVPSTQKARWIVAYGESPNVSTFTGDWGDSMAYDGTLSTPEGVEVQGPYDIGVDMGKGFILDPDNDRLTFVNGTYITSTSDGTLVNVQTSSHSFDEDVSFPDCDKDYAYAWAGTVASVGGGPAQQADGCRSTITALDQEYTHKTTLMAKPAGADFIIGKVRISRTTDPASQWMGRTLAMLPPENKWMSIFGSFGALLEAEFGLSRSIAIYIDGSNNLVLEIKQSVSVAPTDGYGNLPSTTNGITYYNKATLEYGSAPGLPVATREDKDGSFVAGGNFPTGSTVTSHKLGQSQACAIDDNTDYAAEYSVEIDVRFGRRS